MTAWGRAVMSFVSTVYLPALTMMIYRWFCSLIVGIVSSAGVGTAGGAAGVLYFVGTTSLPA
jgi:hypothetical protein